MIIDTVVKGVSYRDVNRKSDGKPIRIFEIVVEDDTKWTTNRIDIANAANAKIGQRVQLQGREEQNGLFVNHYLDMVAEPGVLTPPPSESFPIPDAIQAQRGTTAPIPSVQHQAEIQPTGPTENDWQIWRQVAAKVSAHVSTSPSEFWANLDDLVNYFAYGRKPAFTPGPPASSDQQRFIPESAIQAESPPPYTDDDIPFAWIDEYGKEPRQAMRWHGL